MVSIAYLALVREGALPGPDGRAGGASTSSCPGRTPRAGARAPRRGDRPALARWVGEARDAETRRGRRERADITFASAGGVRPRAVLSATSSSTRRGSSASPGATGRRAPGRPAAPWRADAPRPPSALWATALGRLRGKLKYRPVVFELLPATFTLLRACSGRRGPRRRPAPQAELPAPRREGRPGGGHGRRRAGDRGRPAELFRFRREVLRERRAPAWACPGPVRRLTAGLDFYAPTVAILGSQGQRGCPAF